MERITEVHPAYDRRKDPKGNFGIHNAVMLFVLKGKHGAVSLSVSTGWHLPHVKKEQEQRIVHDIQYGKNLSHAPLLGMEGQGTEYCVHSNVRRSEHEYARHDCEYTANGDCYGTAAYGYAETLFDILVADGTDGLWVQLEKEYYLEFGELQ